MARLPAAAQMGKQRRRSPQEIDAIRRERAERKTQDELSSRLAAVERSSKNNERAVRMLFQYNAGIWSRAKRRQDEEMRGFNGSTH